MGFCSRCGEIIFQTEAKCKKCGGTPAVPAVFSNRGNQPDIWTRTYVSKDRSPTRSTANVTDRSQARTPSPTKRFPRPLSMTSGSVPGIGGRVSAHIASSTSQSNRPPSPLKYSATAYPDKDILPSPSPYDSSLSKVYGSVLQPSESLAKHSCAICSTVFPPDATIYPHPTSPSSQSPQFLCRPCFTTSGGSKGTCPTCSRPVLALKSEGPFVETAGKVWHKRCFNCESCNVNIGSSPMVDLLGRPSCVDCFDNCLRSNRTPNKSRPSATNSPSGNIGGMSIGSKSREGSPAIDELERRLGISKSRESSPELEELSQRLSQIGRHSPTKSPRLSGSPFRSTPKDPSPSPSPRRTNESGLEEMKQRFKRSSHSPATPPISPLRHSQSSGSLSTLSRGDFVQSPRSPATPDLVSDFSDTATQSSSDLDSPPRLTSSDTSYRGKSGGQSYGSRYTRADFLRDPDTILEETGSEFSTPSRTPTTIRKPGSVSQSPSVSPSSKYRANPLGLTLQPQISTSEKCSKCRGKLFATTGSSRYVTISDDEQLGTTRSYHADCFRCAICDGVFKDNAGGQASFVKADKGPCHLDCLPVTKIIKPAVSPVAPSIFSRKAPDLAAVPPVRPKASISSSRYERPPLTAPASNNIFPRFGISPTCPGCHKSVSPMERGVVPGPQGTRWHSDCLVCGGKKESKGFGRIREERNKGEPGCGKKLDSAAKGDGEGGVLCRECWLLLPFGSPTRSTPLMPVYTGGVAPQYTGTTTIARQFTGLGNAEGSLLRQMTGGGLSPTRSLSPTKQLGMRPRPKSVVGIRAVDSVTSHWKGF
ncbi:hypothetical protein C8J56DRAFT_1011674 [Mycena floridula]|nr:hypothetical protein C8J56DRAFT_1011674 [Mycena floridula]